MEQLGERNKAKPSKSTKLSHLPIERLIGPYIPVQGPLKPINESREAADFVRQTFLTVGPYVGRAFSAGLDQARGQPHDWGGGGLPGYGRRYAARYGQFVVQNSLVAGGNALLGYEPRYDFCRCDGFWPRTLHAISRDFVAYNRTKQELRPQVPTMPEPSRRVCCITHGCQAGTIYGEGWIGHVVAGGNRQRLQLRKRILIGHPARLRPEEGREKNARS